MVILCVNIMMLYWWSFCTLTSWCCIRWLFDYFQVRVPIFWNYKHFSWYQLECFWYDLFVYWFLRILKSTLLPHPNTQSSEVIAYLPVDYNTISMLRCPALAVYNQVKKLTTGECTSVLGQKKYVAHRRV